MMGLNVCLKPYQNWISADIIYKVSGSIPAWSFIKELEKIFQLDHLKELSAARTGYHKHGEKWISPRK